MNDRLLLLLVAAEKVLSATRCSSWTRIELAGRIRAALEQEGEVMGEVLSGCAVRAAIQMQGDTFMKVAGVELKNCRVCGNPPKVSKMQDDGIRIGCERDEPEHHRVVVESTPKEFALETWNVLQGADK